jgi:MFS family permease
MVTGSGIGALRPIILVVFIVYLIIGVAMPVLPLRVHDDLGMSAFVVGIVAGSQFGAALLSRIVAGRYADSRGPKSTVVLGLWLASGSGFLYFLSCPPPLVPQWSLVILLTGRCLLGAAESFVITGALS